MKMFELDEFLELTLKLIYFPREKEKQFSLQARKKRKGATNFGKKKHFDNMAFN